MQLLICEENSNNHNIIIATRGVRLAKNDFGSVFGSVWPKTAVFGSVSVSPN